MEETVVATRASSIRRESGTVRAMVMRSITTIVGCAPGEIRERREPGGPFEREEGSRMISATTPSIAGHRIIETKGQVFGLVVRSRGLGGNIAAGLRSLVGGEIHEYHRAPMGGRKRGPRSARSRRS